MRGPSRYTIDPPLDLRTLADWHLSCGGVTAPARFCCIHARGTGITSELVYCPRHTIVQHFQGRLRKTRMYMPRCMVRVRWWSWSVACDQLQARTMVIARPTTEAQVAQEAPASVFMRDPYEVSANSFAFIDRASRRSRSLHRSTRCRFLPTRYAGFQAFLCRFFPRPLAAIAYFCHVASAGRTVRATAQTIATRRDYAHTPGNLLRDI